MHALAAAEYYYVEKIHGFDLLIAVGGFLSGHHDKFFKGISIAVFSMPG